MTVETEVANLTTAVDNLASAVNVKKATLDASVADAQSAQSAAASSATTASGHATSAAASAAAAAATATGIAGFDLDAIAASKAVTAVDVFVYDTSKDSDGGAWRKRTQHTSWYNETLNTATRGGRREFPAVAVIVAEAYKVTIYDGDDPTLPMWMVFTPSAAAATPQIWRAGRSATSVRAGNGVVYLGLATDGHGGLVLMNLISDEMSRYAVDVHTGGISVAQRNEPLTTNSLSTQGIVNALVNDVAMTVLPDAPIDPATGLPVPTIAVATQGGLSVIGNNGAVQSVAPILYANHNYVKNVMISGEEVFITAWSSTQQHTVAVYDIETLSFKREYQTYASLGKVVTPFENTFGITVNKLAYTNSALALGSNTNPSSTASPVKGVGLIAEDKSDRAKGMSAILSATYNTGWMNGDIKGAFLSDTDDTDLVGSGELVTNGDFATNDLTGWTDASTGTAVPDASTGAAVLQRIDSSNIAIITQAITTVAGATYRVSGTVAGGTMYVLAGTSSGGSQLLNANSNTTFAFSFVATTTTTYITNSAAGNGISPSIDNISVKLADADRSVNNNGLIVNGTVTRSAVATGAELVGYSGFSASNYLEQPYNSALDFGTGDFCVMGWISMGSAGVARTVFSKGPLGSNPSPYFEFQTNGDNSLRWVGNNGTSKITTPILPTGIYSHVAFIRASGTGYLYVNGELVDSAANTDNYNHSSADILRFGFRHDGYTNTFNGSLALLRISATAPTAEQIKKIYEDEKVLFQENAAATLYGASDAVTALAHDSDTGLLHVGTSAGRSVFQGLRRVSNTTTAVGAAISAANNLIVEE